MMVIVRNPQYPPPDDQPNDHPSPDDPFVEQERERIIELLRLWGVYHGKVAGLEGLIKAIKGQDDEYLDELKRRRARDPARGGGIWASNEVEKGRQKRRAVYEEQHMDRVDDLTTEGE